VDTLNFCFWSRNNLSFTTSYKGKSYQGYFSLCAAINRALDEGIPITNASYLSTLTLDQLSYIFRSETKEEIPMIASRLSVLREAGRVLTDKFEGNFVNLLKSANNSALKFISLVVEHFPSYRDESTFRERTVYFYKRAQILVADIWGCFEGQGLGYFHDIDSITMFADYRVPQALCQLGVLKYSTELLQRLNDDPYLLPSDPLEIQIRGCSIWSVELLRRKIDELKIERQQGDILVNSVILDFFLWDYAKNQPSLMSDFPFHKTSTIFY